MEVIYKCFESVNIERLERYVLKVIINIRLT
jgi:hypothetical protein